MILLFALGFIPFYLWLSSPEQFRIAKEILSILCLLALCHGNIRVKNIWLTTIPLWAFFVTTIFSFNWYGIPTHFYGWKEIFYIFLACMAIRTIASMEEFGIKNKHVVVNIPSIVRTVAWIISIVVIIQGIYGIIQYLGFDRIFKAMSDFGKVASTNTDPHFSPTFRMVGLLGNPSILATFLAFVAPMGLYLRNKVGYGAVLVTLIVVFLSRCVTAQIVFAVSVLLYVFLSRGIRVFLASVLALLSIVFSIIQIYHINLVTYFNPLGRTNIIKIAWNIGKDYSLTGLGAGLWETTIGYNPIVLNQIFNQSWKEAHCEPVQIVYTLGWIGLVLFIGFVCSMTVKFWKHRTPESKVLFSCLVGFLVCSLAYFPMRIAPHSIYAVILTGLLLREVSRES